jgi:hypothetical protein
VYGVETYFEAEGEKRFSTPYAHALELLASQKFKATFHEYKYTSDLDDVRSIE